MILIINSLGLRWKTEKA